MPGSWSAFVLLIGLISAPYIQIIFLVPVALTPEAHTDATACRAHWKAQKSLKLSRIGKFLCVCVSQMEFACSHVVCNWRPDGAGEWTDFRRHLSVKYIHSHIFILLRFWTCVLLFYWFYFCFIHFILSLKCFYHPACLVFNAFIVKQVATLVPHKCIFTSFPTYIWMN